MSELRDRFFKPCSQCGAEVHTRASQCKSCGAPSPWQAAEADPSAAYASELVDGDAPAANDIGDELTIDEEAPVEPPRPEPNSGFIAIGEFRAALNGGTLVTLKPGQEIPPFLVEGFKAQGYPIASPEEVDHLMACPHCRRVFDMRTANPVRRAAPAA